LIEPTTVSEIAMRARLITSLSFLPLAALLALGPAGAQAAKTVTPIVFSSAWKHDVLSGDEPAGFVRDTAKPGHPVTMIWRHEVAGNLELTFGDVQPGTVIQVAFSETAEYLAIGRTSDWSHTYNTDEDEPAQDGTWVDSPGCQIASICDDGYRAFRFARVFVLSGSAEITSAKVVLSPSLHTPKGWFLSSDDLLNRIWYSSAYTAQLMILPNDPAILDPRGCAMPGGPAMDVVVDGAKRDRCPWLGDQTVTDPTLYLIGDDYGSAIENTLSVFANAQLPNGYIPASPSEAFSAQLFDYPADFPIAVYDLLLYRNELKLVTAYWPAIVKLLDTWYPSHTDANGLLEDPFPPGDYAYIQRGGPLVAYYNAIYVLALKDGAAIADVLGQTDAATRWRARAATIAAAFGSTFWDSSVGAFKDSPTGPVVHPQDGNVFAILAGLATPAQAISALAYLDKTTHQPWGNSIADNDTWATPAWGTSPSQRVYPYISYFDVLARFQSDEATSALEELRRTWGWMLDPAHQTTGTTWEAIGAGGTIDGFEQAATSMASGWSTGAAPALTNEVLGVRPTGPGFSTYDAIPHPGNLTWAQGSVPTPAGSITFGWKRIDGGFLLKLVAPKSLVARVGAPGGPKARVYVDGKRTPDAVIGQDAIVSLSGSHVIEVLD
jgi:Bacterial alpha-L-rhamnosidase 6 hairpin glycosidase domain/Bacterial alpha-L-rhamnosidase C-terminal domain